MGGAGLRGAHTERRCAGVVDGAGVAGGEMSEDPLDDLGSVDARDDAQRGATHTTVFDVDYVSEHRADRTPVGLRMVSASGKPPHRSVSLIHGALSHSV